MIILEVRGDAGAQFSGDCRLSRNGPERRYRIAGKVPAKYWLPAGEARCSLEKADIGSRMTAILSRNGMILIRQSGPPPFRWLSVATGSGKSKARGMATAARPLWQ